MTWYSKHALTLCLLSLLTATGCTAVGVQAKGPQRVEPRLGPGPLRRPTDLHHGFQWRQRVTAKYATGSSSFEAVLLYRQGLLTLIGLSPLGQPGFVITVDAEGRIRMDNRSGRELSFEPNYIVADVQRTFFPWLKSPTSGQHGDRSGQVLGLTVTETFEQGVLRQRRFVRHDAEQRGQILIEYQNWDTGADVPKRVVIHNRWFDYELVIDTLSQTKL